MRERPHITSTSLRTALLSALLLGVLAFVVAISPTTARAQTPSDDATLSNLTISQGTLSPAFNATKTRYLVADIGYGDGETVTVTPTTTHSGASAAVWSGGLRPNGVTTVATGVAARAVTTQVLDIAEAGLLGRIVFIVGQGAEGGSSEGDHLSAKLIDLAAANADAAGITWDGDFLRVLDATEDKVYAYTAAGVHESDEDFDLAADNTDAAGITWAEGFLRVTDSADDEVYAYTAAGVHDSNEDFDLAAAGVHDSNEDFDLAAANADAPGITWDGDFLRVLDATDDKVYAYTAAGVHDSNEDFDLAAAGVHDSNEDFDLAADNTDAPGITWDGDFLRVLDATDDKVYAYTPPASTTATRTSTWPPTTRMRPASRGTGTS